MKKTITSEFYAAERDLALPRIIRKLNGFELKEPFLISELIYDFSRYFAQK